MGYWEGSNWQSRKEDEGKPLFEKESSDKTKNDSTTIEKYEYAELKRWLSGWADKSAYELLEYLEKYYSINRKT